MITKEQIQTLSKKKKIDQDTILREYIQIIFLKELYQEKSSQKIYFKGGTALHLLFSTPRFSMDLDFTSELSSSSLKKIVKKAVERVGSEIPDITLKESKKKTNDSFSKILSYYPKKRKHPLNVVVDFSLREKPVKPVQKTVLETDFPITGLPVIIHLAWEEIMAEKIRALLVRGKGRDLYDIYYLLVKDINIDWKMVREKMKIYPEKLRKKASPKTFKQAILDFDNSDIKRDLGQFLPKPERENLLPILKRELVKKIEEI